MHSVQQSEQVLRDTFPVILLEKHAPGVIANTRQKQMKHWWGRLCNPFLISAVERWFFFLPWRSYEALLYPVTVDVTTNSEKKIRKILAKDGKWQVQKRFNVFLRFVPPPPPLVWTTFSPLLFAGHPHLSGSAAAAFNYSITIDKVGWGGIINVWSKVG